MAGSARGGAGRGERCRRGVISVIAARTHHCLQRALLKCYASLLMRRALNGLSTIVFRALPTSALVQNTIKTVTSQSSSQISGVYRTSYYPTPSCLPYYMLWHLAALNSRCDAATFAECIYRWAITIICVVKKSATRNTRVLKKSRVFKNETNCSKPKISNKVVLDTIPGTTRFQGNCYAMWRFFKLKYLIEYNPILWPFLRKNCANGYLNKCFTLLTILLNLKKD